MLIAANRTLEDIADEFQEMFPFLALAFFSKESEDGADMLNYGNTIPEAGGRITTQEDFPLTSEMTTNDLMSSFFEAYGLVIQVFYVHADGKRATFISAEDRDAPLVQLCDAIKVFRPLKFPGTNRERKETILEEITYVLAKHKQKQKNIPLKDAQIQAEKTVRRIKIFAGLGIGIILVFVFKAIIN